MDKNMFIKTSNPETRNVLKNAGFYEISYDSGIWTFSNDTALNFNFENLKNITFSNKLCF